jgi:hypothetical protein
MVGSIRRASDARQRGRGRDRRLYDGNAEAVPRSWWESDVEFDPERGALFGLEDRRVPLAAALRFHQADDLPQRAMAMQLGACPAQVA